MRCEANLKVKGLLRSVSWDQLIHANSLITHITCLQADRGFPCNIVDLIQIQLDICLEKFLWDDVTVCSDLQVHKFSKFIHGTATLLPDMVQAVPYWVDDESLRPSINSSTPQPVPSLKWVAHHDCTYALCNWKSFETFPVTTLSKPLQWKLETGFTFNDFNRFKHISSTSSVFPSLQTNIC